jgi:Flp pilus assembly protein TadB
VQIEDRNNKRGIGFGGLLARILAAMVSIAVLVVGFMFSLLIFAVALAVGVIVFGWMWWKFRRAIREARQDPRFQQFTEQMQRGAPPGGGGDVIEGEVIRKD